MQFLTRFVAFKDLKRFLEVQTADKWELVSVTPLSANAAELKGEGLYLVIMKKK